MSKKLTYDELKVKYLDLQRRVTKFLAAEQELINTKDKLDQELVLYKRLSNFNTKAFRENNINVFLQLVAEAIVDIFEIEIGIVKFNGEPCMYNDEIFFEGVKASEINDYMQAMIGEQESNTCVLNIGEVYLCNSINANSRLKTWLKVEGIAVNDKCTLSLFAAVSSLKAGFYSEISNKQSTLFNVFSQQVAALFSNLLTLRENKEQLVQIAKSEFELTKLSMIATKTKSGVIISDNQGRIEWVNESFVNATGYKLEEVIGLNLLDFLCANSETSSAIGNRLTDALTKKEKVEVTVLNKSKDGTPFFSQLEITPVFDEKGNHINFIALQKDITKEENYKNDLIKINSRFEMITQSANIGIWELDPATNNIIWNDILKSWYEEELKSTDNTNAIWYNSLHPADKEKVRLIHNDLKNGKTNSNILDYRIITAKKGELIIKSIVIAELDDDGNVKRLFGSLMDITDEHNYNETLILKNSELQKINKELDQFVYSVSHDLRAPLLAIKGLIALIETSKERPELVQQYSELIKTSVNRLDGTILEILDYSKNTRLEVRNEPINIVSLVKQIFEDHSYLTAEKIDFSVFIDGNEVVMSDKSRLTTALQNIIANAIKYKKKQFDDAFVKVDIINTGNEVQMDISDNGEGISIDNQTKVFDMFFRASKSGPGTGLGLYICKEIISKLNGQIVLNSELGVGTTVSIRIKQ